MYMPGRRRTASNPSRTVMSSALYPVVNVGEGFLLIFFLAMGVVMTKLRNDTSVEAAPAYGGRIANIY